MSDTPRQATRRGLRAGDRDQDAIPDWLETAAGWTWRLLLLLIAGLAVLWLLARLLVVSLPIIIALIVSTLAVPPAQALRRRGWRPAAAASLVVIGGLVVIVGTLAILTPSFVDQLTQLGPTLQDAYHDVLTWLETGPLGYDRAQVEQLVSNLGDAVSSGGGSGVVSGVLSGAALVAEGVTGLILAMILTFFFVKDGDQLVQWFIDRTSPAYRPSLRAVGARSWAALGGYVRGTATIALIDALGIMIGLLVLQVPLVAPLTLLVFLGGFLPVIGAFIAGLVAVLVALAAAGIVKALLVLGVILLVQQIEGHLLQPVIMRRAVALHPVVILTALAAGAALAGIVGAFLSVPIAAVVAAAGNELRMRAEAAREGGPGGVDDPAPLGEPGSSGA